MSCFKAFIPSQVTLRESFPYKKKLKKRERKKKTYNSRLYRFDLMYFFLSSGLEFNLIFFFLPDLLTNCTSNR